MICPRCGIVNPPERDQCARCAGSLAAPPARDQAPLPPVVPLTRRAELLMMKTAAAAAAAGAPSSATAPTGDGAPAGGGAADLYRLASQRSSGQPEPPPGSGAGPGPAPAQAGRSDRFVPRLSPAP